MIKPDVHIELWNAFNDISFNEPDHKYTDSKELFISPLQLG